MKDSEEMSPAQNEAFKKAYDLLGEHFDGVILGICIDDVHDEDDGKEKEVTDFLWKGGFARCRGMAEMLVDKFKQKT